MKPNLARAIAALTECNVNPYEFRYFDITDNVTISTNTCTDFVLLTRHLEVPADEVYSSRSRTDPEGAHYNAFCGSGGAPRFLRIHHQHSHVFPCWNGDPHSLARRIRPDAPVTEPYQPSLLEGVS